MDFILEPRVPKGGGSSGGRGGSSGKSSKSGKSGKSSKTSKGGNRVIGGGAGGGGGGGGGGGFGTLPIWARVLIIVLIVWFIVFLVTFACLIFQELKRKKEGKPFRLGRVLGKALLISTGLFLPVLLFKKLRAHRKSKGSGDGTRSGGGAYAKIEEGRVGDDANNRDSWYGAAAGGNKTAEGKYEPMGYRSHDPVPPAYSRPASPNAAAATATAPSQTGAAAEYYLPQPPSHTAPTQHPPQYG
ncbi:hypothetical protein CCHL11_00617 [Colletotrichum chlorophyti]|uniref:Uncharacterized protein n=1 Tax=Colletotrichum chlorophyti TaxID=708187 RepID=A0A1Q8S4W7_9PEZI|nr:hypothetical protein CCHL11_00617 [Colletotrichum chlorophyti]